MGVVTHSIGSAGGRDYSTIAAWQAALPANLVTDGNSQVGECYNDSEFSSGSTLVTFSGNTTDASHTITLTCHAGQSFRDNVNAQTNALRYNQANGVGIKCTGSYTVAIDCSGDNNVFLKGLQCSASVAHTNVIGSIGRTNTFDDLIVEGLGDSLGYALKGMDSATIRNSCIIVRAADGNGIDFAYPSTTVLVGCTVVTTKASTGNGIDVNHGTVKPVNCAVFGFTHNFNAGTGGTFSSSSSNNASDTAISFGTSNQASKTFANQFPNITDGTHDFRLKSGADCIDTGVTDATNGTPDIVGTARPSGSAYDIGCWEFVQAAGDTQEWRGCYPPEQRRLRGGDPSIMY